MKESTHPKYHDKAKIVCASCGAVLVTGSTVPEMRIEVCSNCHPFYTGKQHLIDTAGRVDRFRRIVGRGDSARAARTKKKSSTKESKTEA
ncbi:MAG: 50S ribosomal protein L31 [Candidatus Kerfeldbacteria bacterium]